MSETALDLSKDFPASPRETLAGYVVAKRTLDKCRSVLAGTNGEYHFFFGFAEISADAFKEFVATGANDEAVADWITSNAKQRDRREIIAWNNEMRGKRISEMPIELQEFLEGYIPKYIPQGRVVYVWFDVYDIEEGRI